MIEDPKVEGWHMLTPAGWSGPYKGPNDPQPKLGPVSYWRPCCDCRKLHNGHYQPCEACGLEYRAAVNDPAEGDPDLLGKE